MTGHSGNGYCPVQLAKARERTANAAKIEGSLDEWLIGQKATDQRVLDALWLRGVKLRIAQRQGCWSSIMGKANQDLTRLNVNVDQNEIVTAILGRG